jgi:hypothetical protein
MPPSNDLPNGRKAEFLPKPIHLGADRSVDQQPLRQPKHQALEPPWADDAWKGGRLGTAQDDCGLNVQSHQGYAQFLLSDSGTEAETTGDDNRIPRSRMLLDGGVLSSEDRLDRLLEDVPERTTWFPEVRVACDRLKMLSAAQFHEPQATSLDRFLEVPVGKKGNLMSSLVKLHSDAEHRMDITGAPNRREDEMHPVFSNLGSFWLRLKRRQRFRSPSGRSHSTTFSGTSQLFVAPSSPSSA